MLLSAILIAKENAPAAVAVPVMLPADEFRCNPAGNVPEVMDQVYGAVPLRGRSVKEYASPSVPFGAAVVRIAKGGGATVMLSVCAETWAGNPLSVTCTVNEYVPERLGVPEIIPVPLTLNPRGSVPVLIAKT
jgi:hypothetical protein